MAKARLSSGNMFMSQGTSRPEITIQLQGIEGVNAGLVKLGKDAKRLIKKVARRNMKPMLNTLRSLTPVRTGTLRRAWTLRSGKGSQYATSTIIARRKNSDAYYAHMIEDGFHPRGGDTRVPGAHMIANTFRSQASGVSSKVASDLVNEMVNQWDRGESSTFRDSFFAEIDEVHSQWDQAAETRELENSLLSGEGWSAW